MTEGHEERRRGEDRRSHEAPAPDASKLTFPVQTLVMVVAVVISVLGTTWGMRSDLRDIQTRAELRQSAYVEDRENLQADVRQMRGKIEMMTIEIQNLNLALARAGLDTKRN